MVNVTGHPVRLPDGTWGARVDTPNELKAGDQVEMRNRAGETWTATLTQVLESYRGVHLVKVRR